MKSFRTTARVFVFVAKCSSFYTIQSGSLSRRCRRSTTPFLLRRSFYVVTWLRRLEILLCSISMINPLPLYNVTIQLLDSIKSLDIFAQILLPKQSSQRCFDRSHHLSCTVYLHPSEETELLSLSTTVSQNFMLRYSDIEALATTKLLGSIKPVIAAVMYVKPRASAVAQYL